MVLSIQVLPQCQQRPVKGQTISTLAEYQLKMVKLAQRAQASRLDVLEDIERIGNQNGDSVRFWRYKSGAWVREGVSLETLKAECEGRKNDG